MHFKGFVVRIATKDDADNKVIHYFRVLPKSDGNGYTIDYTDNVNSDIIIKLLDSEDKINTLFDGINYNFLNVIKTVLSSIRGNTKTIGGRNVSMDNIVASVFNGEELSEEACRSGTLELYPIDAYYDVHRDKDNKIVVDTNKIPRDYFSPYESELYA